jgi:hypothetical protein
MRLPDNIIWKGLAKHFDVLRESGNRWVVSEVEGKLRVHLIQDKGVVWMDLNLEQAGEMVAAMQEVIAEIKALSGEGSSPTIGQ